LISLYNCIIAKCNIFSIYEHKLINLFYNYTRGTFRIFCLEVFKYWKMIPIKIFLSKRRRFVATNEMMVLRQSHNAYVNARTWPHGRGGKETFQAWHTCHRWSPSSTTRKYPRDTSATRSDDFSNAQSRSLARAKIIITFIPTKYLDSNDSRELRGNVWQCIVSSLMQ